MKTYVCGQGYIGAPGFGLLTPGEVLTEAHVRALGEERLNELVKSHALDVMVTRGEQQPDVNPGNGENGAKTDQESTETDPEAPEIDHSDEDAAKEDESPVALELPDDLVKDEEEPKPAKATKTKTAGRGKTK